MAKTHNPQHTPTSLESSLESKQVDSTLSHQLQRAQIFMRWGAIALPICAALGLATFDDLSYMALVAGVGYVCACACYLFGAYALTQAIPSPVLWLNFARFVLIVASVLGALFVDEVIDEDAFYVIMLCFIGVCFGVINALLEWRIQRLLFAITKARYFVLGLRCRLGALGIFVCMCAWLGIGVSVGVDLQMLQSDNTLLFAIYVGLIGACGVLGVVSSIAYVLGYWNLKAHIIANASQAHATMKCGFGFCSCS